MADIDVVKKGSSLWLWIILAMVIAVALWFMMAGSGTRSNGSGTRLDQQQHQLLQVPAHSYQRYV